jgi:uncharacterized protein (DUF2461 family)
MIEFLRLKQFFVGVECEEKECEKPRFLDVVTRVFTTAMPFIRWLQTCEGLSPSQVRPIAAR